MKAAFLKEFSPKDIISHTFPVIDISQALQLASSCESGNGLLNRCKCDPKGTERHNGI